MAEVQEIRDEVEDREETISMIHQQLQAELRSLQRRYNALITFDDSLHDHLSCLDLPRFDLPTVAAKTGLMSDSIRTLQQLKVTTASLARSFVQKLSLSAEARRAAGMQRQYQQQQQQQHNHRHHHHHPGLPDTLGSGLGDAGSVSGPTSSLSGLDSEAEREYRSLLLSLVGLPAELENRFEEVCACLANISALYNQQATAALSPDAQTCFSELRRLHSSAVTRGAPDRVTAVDLTATGSSSLSQDPSSSSSPRSPLLDTSRADASSIAVKSARSGSTVTGGTPSSSSTALFNALISAVCTLIDSLRRLVGCELDVLEQQKQAMLRYQKDRGSAGGVSDSAAPATHVSTPNALQSLYQLVESFRELLLLLQCALNHVGDISSVITSSSGSAGSMMSASTTSAAVVSGGLTATGSALSSTAGSLTGSAMSSSSNQLLSVLSSTGPPAHSRSVLAARRLAFAQRELPFYCNWLLDFFLAGGDFASLISDGHLGVISDGMNADSAVSTASVTVPLSSVPKGIVTSVGVVTTNGGAVSTPSTDQAGGFIPGLFVSLRRCVASAAANYAAHMAAMDQMGVCALRVPLSGFNQDNCLMLVDALAPSCSTDTGIRVCVQAAETGQPQYWERHGGRLQIHLAARRTNRQLPCVLVSVCSQAARSRLRCS